MSAQKTPTSQGFHSDSHKMIHLPQAFFTKLLPIMDDLPQLRLLLYMFWHLEQQEGAIRYFKLKEMTTDPTLIQMTGNEEALKTALQGLADLGIVISTDLAGMNDTTYFINDSQGQAAIEAIKQGKWQETITDRPPIHLIGEQPNLFKLYEENIGTITPMMAEILKADETAFPASWIEDAIRIAVTRNARNWKYVQAILERWKKEGRGNGQNRRDNSQDPGSYRESWLKRD